MGKPFIANPDLVERLQRDVRIAMPNGEPCYGVGAKGYTDYPAYQDNAEARAA